MKISKFLRTVIGKLIIGHYLVFAFGHELRPNGCLEFGDLLDIRSIRN